MLYEALVIDNSDFTEKGTIRVRIKDRTTSPIFTSDISVDPQKSINFYGGQEWKKSDGQEEFIYTDTDVKVSSPFGGGYDYGVFYLPQPNSWGIVARLGNPWEDRNRDNFVWIGSVYERSIITKTIHTPSDKIDGEIVSGIEGDGEKTKVNIDNLSSALVIKTKTTYISGGAKNINQDKSKKTLDWKRRPAENLIVIDKDKVKISHNILDDEEKTKALATFTMDENGFNMTFDNKENLVLSKLTIDNLGNFEINKTDNENSIQERIAGDNNGIVAEYGDGDEKSAALKLGGKPAGLPADYKAIASLTSFENGKSTCSVNVKSNGIDIESAGDVNINPGANCKVSIGGTGLPVLVSPTGSDVLVGNVTIPCSTNLYG